MLQTVYKDPRYAELISKRKRISELLVDPEYGLSSPSKKIKLENGKDGNDEVEDDITFDDLSESKDDSNVLQSPMKNETSELSPSKGLPHTPSREIITKLLQAFGKSVLGAVRSLPLHSELDMSLGIAGLHSLKMEREKAIGLGLMIDSTQGPGSGPGSGEEKQQKDHGLRTHLPLGPESSHPFSRAIDSILRQSLSENEKSNISSDCISILPSDVPEMNQDEDNENGKEIEKEKDKENDIESKSASKNKGAAHSLPPLSVQPSRSLSISSAATTQDRWSQDVPEEDPDHDQERYHELIYDENDNDNDNEIEGESMSLSQSDSQHQSNYGLKYAKNAKVSPYGDDAPTFKDDVSDYNDFDSKKSNQNMLETKNLKSPIKSSIVVTDIENIIPEIVPVNNGELSELDLAFIQAKYNDLVEESQGPYSDSTKECDSKLPHNLSSNSIEECPQSSEPFKMDIIE